MIRPARAAAAVAAAALATASCGLPRLRLPSGPGTPASDGPAVLAAATAACRGTRTLTAEIHVSGRVRGRRVSGRLAAGFAAPGSARIEAAAPFGAPVFVFTATGDRASLLLPRDQRVVRDAPADALLDALVGIPLTPAALWTIVTACPEPASIGNARQFGDDWRRVEAPPDEALYFHRDASGWRLAASVRQTNGTAREVQYLRYDGVRPVRLHLSAGGRDQAAAYEIGLELSQVETNVALGPEAFELQVPPEARPMTLDELRRASPLTAPGGSHD